MKEGHSIVGSFLSFKDQAKKQQMPKHGSKTLKIKFHLVTLHLLIHGSLNMSHVDKINFYFTTCFILSFSYKIIKLNKNYEERVINFYPSTTCKSKSVSKEQFSKELNLINIHSLC